VRPRSCCWIWVSVWCFGGGHGGPTNITNGGSLCQYHHSLVHKGFTATDTANGAITYHRPDGTLIDTTHPLARNWQIAA
jgi:hypothetical protein